MISEVEKIARETGPRYFDDKSTEYCMPEWLTLVELILCKCIDLQDQGSKLSDIVDRIKDELVREIDQFPASDNNTKIDTTFRLIRLFKHFDDFGLSSLLNDVRPSHYSREEARYERARSDLTLMTMIRMEGKPYDNEPERDPRQVSYLEYFKSRRKRHDTIGH